MMRKKKQKARKKKKKPRGKHTSVERVFIWEDKLSILEVSEDWEELVLDAAS